MLLGAWLCFEEIRGLFGAIENLLGLKSRFQMTFTQLQSCLNLYEFTRTKALGLAELSKIGLEQASQPFKSN